MSENSTHQPAAPILRDNGVPLVPRRGPHRPLAPSQALTQVQEQRVKALIAKETNELRARVERLEKMLAALTQAPPASGKEKPVSEVEPPAKQEQKPAAAPAQAPAAVKAQAKPAAPDGKAIPLPTANAEISEAAQKIIDRAKSPDLKRALVAIAKKDVPEEVKLKQMEAALKKHEPAS